MQAKLWKIDDVTDLLLFEDGRYSVMWAAAQFGPVNTLEEIVEGDLLNTCQAKLKLTPDRVVNVHNCDTPGGTITVLIGDEGYLRGGRDTKPHGIIE
jgi:hypothetical protein